MNWLFGTESFVRRGVGWTHELQLIFILSNLVIAFAYFLIPIMLIILYRSKRQELPSSWILVLFASFITFSGISHLMDVFVFYWAPYRFYTLISFIAALLSFATAVMMPRIINTIVKLPSREFVHNLNDILQGKISILENKEVQDKIIHNALKAKLLEAEERIEELKAFRESCELWKTRKAVLLELDNLLSEHRA